MQEPHWRSWDACRLRMTAELVSIPFPPNAAIDSVAASAILRSTERRGSIPCSKEKLSSSLTSKMSPGEHSSSTRQQKAGCGCSGGPVPKTGCPAARPGSGLPVPEQATAAAASAARTDAGSLSAKRTLFLRARRGPCAALTSLLVPAAAAPDCDAVSPADFPCRPCDETLFSMLLGDGASMREPCSGCASSAANDAVCSVASAPVIVIGASATRAASAG